MEKGKTVSVQGNDRLRRPIFPPGLVDRFAAVRNVTMAPKSNDTWRDDQLLQLPHVNLEGYRSIDDKGTKKKLLREAMKPLYHTVSARTVGRLIQVAWALVSPESGNYIFPVIESAGPTTDVENLESNGIKKPVEINLGKGNADLSRLEKTAAFYCAAALRLVTKDETNLQKAWNGLERQYRNFYHEDIAFTVAVNTECLAALRNLIQRMSALKGSLGLFLYAFLGMTEKDQRICSLLFEKHMAYTGLHVYTLFAHIVEKTKVSPTKLVALFSHPTCRNALNLISLLIRYDLPKTREDIEAAKSRKGWKYARIFDPSAFATIQTKNCVSLTAHLAVVVERLGGMGGSGKVTEITQIRGYVANEYETLLLRADYAIDAIEKARSENKGTQM